MRMIDSWRARKAKNLQDQKDEADERKLRLEKSLIASNKEMIGNPCAINNMQPCTDECTHFKGAEIKSWINVDPPMFRHYLEGAKCKLWSNQ